MTSCSENDGDNGQQVMNGMPLYDIKTSTKSDLISKLSVIYRGYGP
jgi:hypothetical protein